MPYLIKWLIKRVIKSCGQNLHLNGKKIGVIDEDGSLINVLNKAGIPFKVFKEKDSISGMDVVLNSSKDEISNGINLTWSGYSSITFLNNNRLRKGSARLFVNGASYKVLNGITQQELTFWKGGNEYGGMAVSYTHLTLPTNREV